MRVLVACEFSGRVRDAFVARGHDAWSCDILPTESPGNHIQGDVLEVLSDGWDLMVAHPPCTYLANSGVQWLHKRPERWGQLRDARRFFMKFYRAKIPMKAIENPLPHKYGRLPPYTQIIHPWMFGDEVMKKTCLWLDGLPQLVPTKIVGKGEKYVGRNGKPNGSKWYQILSAGKDRQHIRSVTFPGIAKAMAEQWG